MRCPYCDTYLEPNAQFCGRCHAVCGRRGIDSGDVTGKAFEHWNGAVCSGIFTDDGVRCCAWIVIYMKKDRTFCSRCIIRYSRSESFIQ